MNPHSFKNVFTRTFELPEVALCAVGELFVNDGDRKLLSVLVPQQHEHQRFPDGRACEVDEKTDGNLG